MYHSRAIRTAAISPTLGSMAYQCRTHSEANKVLLHQYRRWYASCFGRRTWWQRYGSVSPYIRMPLRAMVFLTDRTPPECLSWRTAWLLKGKGQCPYSTSMGVAEQLPIAVFLRHAAVENPDRRYPFPSHSLTSYQIFCRNPAVSPWYHHTCSASNASIPMPGFLFPQKVPYTRYLELLRNSKPAK